MITLEQGGDNTVTLNNNGTIIHFRTDCVRLEANGDNIQITVPEGTILVCPYSDVSSPSSTSANDLIDQVSAWL